MPKSRQRRKYNSLIMPTTEQYGYGESERIEDNNLALAIKLSKGVSENEAAAQAEFEKAIKASLAALEEEKLILKVRRASLEEVSGSASSCIKNGMLDAGGRVASDTSKSVRVTVTSAEEAVHHKNQEGPEEYSLFTPPTSPCSSSSMEGFFLAEVEEWTAVDEDEPWEVLGDF
eukprot:TRINITY_DN65445_c0_g1_i1.p1 TRINITY_DN65445_c0_g1~~TRINITY_DN65445_c0_g1_i1.p1  ORF type:complete len:174 (-),score=45.03 TRINITY_DN65445_c0_g1_i1:378-899(-)